MSKYREKYISNEEYEAIKQRNALCEGFVRGKGYAYCLADAKYYHEGNFYDMPVGSRFSVNIPVITHTQYIDTSPEMVAMSYGAVLLTPYSDFTVEYSVKTGDTLFSLASMFKCSVENIVMLNDISDANKIYPGQKLIIQPDKTRMSPPATTKTVVYVRPYKDKKALDPATVGRNWSGSYLGPNNPMTIRSTNDNIEWSYEAPAANANDYPAIRHDRFYDIMKIEGAAGVLFNTKVLGADYRFVYEEFTITFGRGYNFKERTVGAASGIVIGFGSLPKTAWHIANSNPGTWLFEIVTQFVASGEVSDQPDTPKRE